MSLSVSLDTLYDLLFLCFGPQNWWPVDTEYHRRNRSDPRFEIMIGAILTQNTAWSNVEKALHNLKQHSCLTIQSIAEVDIHKLRTCIQPSGYFNQKSVRLQQFAQYLLKSYQNDLNLFFSRSTPEIRAELLSLSGIGPETADSILLYAGNHPVFVVDAYTKRLCKRIPFPSGETYQEIQCFFHDEIKRTKKEHHVVSMYKEFHALIVQHAKNICKTKPDCETCCLQRYCDYSLQQQTL